MAYTDVLDLLDDYDYDYGCIKKPDGISSIYTLTYNECRTFIDKMKFSDTSEVFGVEKENGKLEVGRMIIMKKSRDFKKEYEAFLKKVPYQTAVVDGVEVRYQYGGKDGAPVILFFNNKFISVFAGTSFSKRRSIGVEKRSFWMPLI